MLYRVHLAMNEVRTHNIKVESREVEGSVGLTNDPRWPITTETRLLQGMEESSWKKLVLQLFQYCYKYCYDSDSRNLWAVMKTGGLAL
jgi:hypothetical protein